MSAQPDFEPAGDRAAIWRKATTDPELLAEVRRTLRAARTKLGLAEESDPASEAPLPHPPAASTPQPEAQHVKRGSHLSKLWYAAAVVASAAVAVIRLLPKPNSRSK